MTVDREVLFLKDSCYITEPGHLLDASGLTAFALAEHLPSSGAAVAVHDITRVLAARSRGRYLDYADKNALETDRALMMDYLLADQAPAPEPDSGGALVWLPHPAFVRLRGLPSAVAELLLMGFGVLRDADFLGLFGVPLKAPPSKGARHPFDAYIAVGPDVDLPAGVFRYVPSKHALFPVGPATKAHTGVAIAVTVVFERVQWRYREVSGYTDTLLDLGHLKETVQVAAGELGLYLRTVPIPEGVSDTPLVEEAVVAWHVDALPAE